MFRITAQKLRPARRDERCRRDPARNPAFDAFVLSPPRVGNSLVLFRAEGGARLVSSRIVRVMRANKQVFVETENSVYRIELRERVVYREGEKRFIPVTTAELSA